MYIACGGTDRIEVVTVCGRYAYHQIPKNSGRSGMAPGGGIQADDILILLNIGIL